MSSEFVEDIVIKEEYEIGDFNVDFNKAPTSDESKTKCGEVFWDHPDGYFVLICVLCQERYSDLISFGDHIRDIHPLPKIETPAPDTFHYDIPPIKLEPPDYYGHSTLENSEDKKEPISFIEAAPYNDCDEANEDMTNSSSNDDDHCQYEIQTDGDSSKSQTESTKQDEQNRKTFCCYSCGTIFVLFETYWRHYWNTHPDMVEKEDRAKSMCDQTSFVPKVPKEMLCKYCLKTFHNTSTYHKHMESAHIDRFYACPYCPKSFAVKATRDRHANAHEGKRPHKCPHCPKAFTVPTALEYHINAHLNLKQFACRFCDNKFVRKCVLKRHELIHTGVKPYKCNECGMAHIDRRALNAHIRRYHPHPSHQ